MGDNTVEMITIEVNGMGMLMVGKVVMGMMMIVGMLSFLLGMLV